ncbi:MAG: hypothetical protein ABIF77_02845 [bacterium]
MARTQGCFKTGMLGCLGLLVIVVLFVGITALVAWRGVEKQEIEKRQRTPVMASPEMVAEPRLDSRETDGQIIRGERNLGVPPTPGRVVLDLGQGEFEILPAQPGEGLSVEARYDKEVYELKEHLETMPDSSWVYHLRFERTMPGLQAIFRALMGGDTDCWVHVYLPPDIPLALELNLEAGGVETDLGGLWLTEADINFSKGGFALDISQPLREPMERLSIRGRMGGFEADDLGNASPRLLDLDFAMGGADIDLTGLWLQDADIRLKIRMGGMAVRVPQDCRLEGVPMSGARLTRDDAEVPPPLLRFDVSESMGEIEFH